MNTFNYDFEELPLVIENGFEACDVSGTAEISYSKDGEWGVESISFEGSKRNRWTIDDYYRASLLGKQLPPYERKPVALDRGTPIFAIIHDRLESEWRDKVQTAVSEQIAEDRECAAEYRADLRRDELMMERSQ